MDIGMIGVGLMGLGIATNLQRHGHALVVLEHPGNQPLDALIAAGAVTCATPREVASAADIVILCVTGTPQVEAVLLADEGVLAGLRPGGIVIDCSTAVPHVTQHLAGLVQAAGGRLLDAPMTRTPKEAAAGRLNLLVGGDADVFDTCLPLLCCFAEHIVHVGPVGAGHRMKLLHNYVSLGMVALLAEAGACAQAAGIDPAVFVDVLAQGGGHGAALDRLRPYLLDADSSGLRFSLGNARKDLGYYTDMATEAGVRQDIAQAVYQVVGQAAQQGGADALLPELVALLRAGQAGAP